MADRLGARARLTVGPLVAAAGFALLALSAGEGSYETSVLPGMLALGLGMAASVAPLTTTVMNAVEQERTGVASGINNAAARVAALLAIAILGAAMLIRFRAALDERLAPIRVPDAARPALERARTDLAAVELPGAPSPGSREALEAAIDGAFLDGFRLVLLVAAGLAAAAGACGWITIGRPVRGP